MLLNNEKWRKWTDRESGGRVATSIRVLVVSGAYRRHGDSAGILGEKQQIGRTVVSEPCPVGQTASLSDVQIRQVTIGEPERLDGPIPLVAYDPAWPANFAREAERIRGALGDRVMQIEHVGSTSVPGLDAKPVVDILLVVADSSDEVSYIPALEAAGYVLRIREPEWHEHRLFKGPTIALNLHVFSVGSSEIERMLLFRDWLRENAADRELYLQTKRDLARQNWGYVQNYADAKSAVVETIIARAGEARSRARLA
jgi:GrpB-like predicted nucleotidyltransferase (UPF0157 family)